MDKTEAKGWLARKETQEVLQLLDRRYSMDRFRTVPQDRLLLFQGQREVVEVLRNLPLHLDDK